MAELKLVERGVCKKIKITNSAELKIQERIEQLKEITSSTPDHTTGSQHFFGEISPIPSLGRRSSQNNQLITNNENKNGNQKDALQKNSEDLSEEIDKNNNSSLHKSQTNQSQNRSKIGREEHENSRVKGTPKSQNGNESIINISSTDSLTHFKENDNADLVKNGGNISVKHNNQSAGSADHSNVELDHSALPPTIEKRKPGRPRKPPPTKKRGRPFKYRQPADKNGDNPPLHQKPDDRTENEIMPPSKESSRITSTFKKPTKRNLTDQADFKTLSNINNTNNKNSITRCYEKSKTSTKESEQSLDDVRIAHDEYERGHEDHSENTSVLNPVLTSQQSYEKRSPEKTDAHDDLQRLSDTSRDHGPSISSFVKNIDGNGNPIPSTESNNGELDSLTPPIVKPKPPSATSIPATLKPLQDELDSGMQKTQRLQFQTARQELSHALYQHDCREALARLKPQAGITTVPQPAVAAEPFVIAAQPIEPSGMSTEVKMQEKATVLTQERKKRGRTVPEELATQDRIRVFKTFFGLHPASIPGILALDVHSTDTSKVLTGGNDKNARVSNTDTEQVVAILKGHTEKVTKVIYHSNEDIVLTASPDSTIRVWHVPTSQTTLLLRCHDSPVTGLSLHPTGDYVLSTSGRHWAFSDINTGRLLTKVSDKTNSYLTTAQLHPDGLSFGTGTADSQVKIWDLKEQINVANFTGHSGAITTISFSENGYYLATAADDACVKLWDLRKLENFKTLQFDKGYQIRDLCFDQSGTYLAVAGTDVRIYLCKQWQELKIFNDHTDTAKGVRFGKHANFIVSTSMDSTLKFYDLD